jgi:acyl carrier protein
MAREGFFSSVFGRGVEESAPPARSEQEIKAWLVARLAREIQVPISEIDTARPFTAYGLDSRTAVSISGELEKAVERRLSPAILIEQPCIDDVATQLALELSGEAAE